VDWRYCLSGKPDVDVEVVGTHLGLPVNAAVFRHIAARLALAGKSKGKQMTASHKVGHAGHSVCPNKSIGDPARTAGIV
jgi:hypothetical protein